MTTTVLIVEDDRRIANWLTIYFEHAGFETETASDGEAGLSLARALAPDLVVLDLMLPRLDGIAVCERLRRESDVPIIMLTAREAHADRIKGLDCGADDYVVKPFDPKEVVARAKAVMRRVRCQTQRELICDKIILNMTTRQVTVESRPIALSQSQFALLAAFMRHPNQVLSRDQLISLAFDNDFDGFDRAIDNHILRLRKQLKLGDRQPIQTVYGAGYRFVAKNA